MDKHYVQWFLLKSVSDITVREKKLDFAFLIYNRNRLYSRAIHSPASMEMHYVQWFLLKSVYEIMDCAKN